MIQNRDLMDIWVRDQWKKQEEERKKKEKEEKGNQKWFPFFVKKKYLTTRSAAHNGAPGRNLQEVKHSTK